MNFYPEPDGHIRGKVKKDLAAKKDFIALKIAFIG